VFRSVVVGATTSESAAHAIAQACEVARASGGTLHLVTAFKAHRPMPDELPEEFRYSFGPIDPVDRFLARLEAEAQMASIHVTTHPVMADPVEAIMKVARQEHADLIVVGSKCRHGTRRLSGVPRAVMDSASCAVLVV
jgi:nucleotide-binding universal stress UspA family protein